MDLLDTTSLGNTLDAVNEALARASQEMITRLSEGESEGTWPTSFYCCGPCTCALWRHLAVGELERGEERVVAGMEILQAHRSDDGRWRRFPIYHMLLVLSDLDLPYAGRELRYAAPACERALKIPAREKRAAGRRRPLLERALNSI